MWFNAMKFAPEGYPFIIVFMVLTGIGMLVWGVKGAVLPLALTLFMLYFFRDPERIPPAEAGFISPADGKVIVIKDADEPTFLKGNAKMISIFMSPLNVHVNRAPCSGKVMEVKYSAGRYLAAYHDDASRLNENTAMVFKCNSTGRDILVRQVAGFVARRTVNRMSEGAALARGERFGIIKFSSRVDIHLPVDVEVKVKLGDVVKAGETIIAVTKEEVR